MSFKPKKLLKMVGIIFGGVLVLILLIGLLFMSMSPQFGGDISDEQQKEFEHSANYSNGKFINRNNVKMRDLSFKQYIDLTLKFFGSQPNAKPSNPLTVEKVDSLSVVNFGHTSPRIIWFGHSTVLLQIEGKNILIDPMFSEAPAPHPWLGSSRFSNELPIGIDNLPPIDLVIISHDHYDHLDYGSIQKLKDKVKMFCTPLGVGCHLINWGVNKDQIQEMDWWQETTFENLKLICAPAQHFSGRGLSDRNNTLWASWIVQTNKNNIYFSGDSGYGDHFKEIGNKYGPFDFTMLECGQYNEQWLEIHMMPEETAQAAVDLKSKLMMPIHWGAFKLALHTWTDPIDRVYEKAEELGINMATPAIGEEVIIGDSIGYPTSKWWSDQ